MGKIFITFILPLFLLSTHLQNAEACFSIVAGKSATTDGSVLLGHNEDNDPDDLAGITEVERSSHGSDEWIILPGGGRVPQQALTYGYLCMSMPYVDIADNVLNEHGVAVVSNHCPSREDKPEISDGGIGSPTLRHLVAQRAGTAREGVRLVGSLVEKFGYTPSGRTLLICDPNEGWLLGLARGKHWAAVRVPDDEVAFLANTFSIHEIDLKDTANFLGSPGLVEYAEKRGWYDPEKGPFDFEKAFAARQTRLHAGNLNRQWSAMSRISAENIPLPKTQNLPFSIKPKSKMSVRKLFSILRDHYEGTSVWRMDPEYDATPHNGPFPICNHDTNYSSVYQLRSHMPVEIGALWWCAMWAPCSSPYIPIHLGMDGISPDLGFSTNKNGAATGFGPAFKRFRSLKDRIHKNFAKRKPALQKMWRQLEDASFKIQENLEKKAVEKWPEDKALSREMLTVFSRGSLARAMKQADSLLGHRTD